MFFFCLVVSYEKCTRSVGHYQVDIIKKFTTSRGPSAYVIFAGQRDVTSRAVRYFDYVLYPK